MFGFFRGYGGGNYFDDDVDRSGWRDKSDAAERREQQAIQLFQRFFQACKTKNATEFPFTEDATVPCGIHLTDPCWKSFKQVVLNHGCTTKRREASMQEKHDSKDGRKGKMYVISCSCPVHPDIMKEVEKEKKVEAARKQEIEKIKVGQKQEAAAKAAEKERVLEAQIEKEYSAIVSFIGVETTTDSSSSSSSSSSETEETETPSSSKKRKLPPSTSSSSSSSSSAPTPTPVKFKITVPAKRLESYASSKHINRLSAISQEINRDKLIEREALLRTLDEKWVVEENRRKKVATEYNDKIKNVINPNPKNPNPTPT